LYPCAYIVAGKEDQMLGRACLFFTLLWSVTAQAGNIVDATGRTVQVPDQITRVLPAGPPAAILLEVLAPDLMLGWTSALPDAPRAMLAPAAATLPQIPRLTGREDVTGRIQALKPDLILDYGTISPRYAALAETTQQRTGVPTLLLNGSLAEIPHVLRLLGGVLHRESRAETLVLLAEAILALPARSPHPRVVYARGADGLNVAAPGTDVTAVFAQLGWVAVAPDGDGPFRPASVDAIRALDPDILIFAAPKMAEVFGHDDAWQAVRAVREKHAYIAPALPFGWIEEPPSINRLLGLAWLSGGDPATLASMFTAVAYGHVLTPAQLGSALTGTRQIQP
jgi:iron complex transport system substrate-binding protein